MTTSEVTDTKTTPKSKLLAYLAGGLLIGILLGGLGASHWFATAIPAAEQVRLRQENMIFMAKRFYLNRSMNTDPNHVAFNAASEPEGKLALIQSVIRLLPDGVTSLSTNPDIPAILAGTRKTHLSIGKSDEQIHIW